MLKSTWLLSSIISDSMPLNSVSPPLNLLLPYTYPLFFNTIQLPPSILNILGLSLSGYYTFLLWVNQLLHRLVFTYIYSIISLPSQMLTTCKGLVCPRMKYVSCLWGSNHTVFQTVFHLISSAPLTDCLLPPNLHCNVASLCFLSLFLCYLLFWTC